MHQTWQTQSVSTKTDRSLKAKELFETSFANEVDMKCGVRRNIYAKGVLDSQLINYGVIDIEISIFRVTAPNFLSKFHVIAQIVHTVKYHNFENYDIGRLKRRRRKKCFSVATSASFLGI